MFAICLGFSKNSTGLVTLMIVLDESIHPQKEKLVAHKPF